MSYNEYDAYYSQLPFEELINRLKSHLRTGNSLSKEWYDGLILHFEKRNLTDDQRIILQRALNGEKEPTDIATLNANGSQLSNEQGVDGPGFPWFKAILAVIGILLGIIELVITLSK